MIDSIFEKLFRPVTQAELRERMTANFKLVDEYRAEMPSNYDVALANKYYECYPDLDWLSIHEELENPLCVPTRERAMMSAYREWKKTWNEIDEILEKKNDNGNI